MIDLLVRIKFLEQLTGLALVIIEADKKLNSSYQDKHKVAEKCIAQVTKIC